RPAARRTTFLALFLVLSLLGSAARWAVLVQQQRYLPLGMIRTALEAAADAVDVALMLGFGLTALAIVGFEGLSALGRRLAASPPRGSGRACSSSSPSSSSRRPGRRGAPRRPCTSTRWPER